MLLHKGAEGFGSVVGDRAVRFLEAQGIVNAVFCPLREIFFPEEFFIADFLDPGILGGVNAQAAAEDGPVRLLGGIALFFHEKLQHLMNQSVFIIRIDGGLFVKLVLDGDFLVDLCGQRFAFFRFRNVSLLLHISQDNLAPLLVLLRMQDGIVGGGVLGNRGQNRGFSQGEILHIFSEIPPGGCLHAIAAGPQIDGIEIVFQNFLLRHPILQLQGQILLLDFPGKTVEKGCFLGPLGKDAVFNQLLGNRAGAL